MSLSLSRFKIVIETEKEDYGFSCSFNKGLNIVRGNNTSGKSTLFHSLVYALGMEEIIGSKGEKTLQYALKDYVEDSNKNRIKVKSSYLLLEIYNQRNEYRTIKRFIKSNRISTKLAEIYEGDLLSSPDKKYNIIYTYLHDKGSAQNSEVGFFKYLEDYLGMDLPLVHTSKGNDVKLYLQTIFSALFIEQKRGWTDYVANIPYYGIKSVKTKVIQYLLGLDVFKLELNKNRLKQIITNLQDEWDKEYYKVKFETENSYISATGLTKNIMKDFVKDTFKLTKFKNDEIVNIYDYLRELENKKANLEKKGLEVKNDTPKQLIEDLENYRKEVIKLTFLLDTNNSDLNVAKTRLSNYIKNKEEIENDLNKNNLTIKLKKLGADQKIDIATDICPTCHQKMDDSLLLADTLIQPMNLEENVKYLQGQLKIVNNYIIGLNNTIKKIKLQSKEISQEMINKSKLLESVKKDIKSYTLINEKDIKLKIQLEDEIERIYKTIQKVEYSVKNLEIISKDYKKYFTEISNIPSSTLSNKDYSKIKKMESIFKSLTEKFEYKSAPIESIEINVETLMPYLSGIELREVNTNIKSDSSASDFVRLIWAYLLSITQIKGNHLGIIAFDEPAQHSMAVTSINSLLKELSGITDLQGIIAASFDEDDEVYNNSISGVKHHLIKIGDRLLTPTS